MSYYISFFVPHFADSCLQEELSTALKEVLSGIKLTERGVFVQASTLGSLEALLEFLRTSKIPVSIPCLEAYLTNCSKN